jgi:hypothetical protein
MKKVVFIALAVLSVNAFSWSDKDLEVDYIDVLGNGGVAVYFKVSGDVPNPASCSKVGTVTWEAAHISAANFLSTFLSAKMANKKVQVQVYGDSCLWGGWPKVETVRIK